MPLRVNREIVPSALTTDRKSLHDLPRRLRRCGFTVAQQKERQDRQNHSHLSILLYLETSLSGRGRRLLTRLRSEAATYAQPSSAVQCFRVSTRTACCLGDHRDRA